MDTHVHLGLSLNNQMTWNDHADRLFTRTSKTINSLKRIRHIAPRKTLQSLYCVLVRSVLDYCDVVYSYLPSTYSKKLDAIQREAALISTGAIRRTATERVYCEVGWEPLSRRRQNNKMIMYFKILHELTPEYLREIIPVEQNRTTRYMLRNRDEFRPSYARTERFLNYFSVDGVRKWNELPDEMKRIDSLKMFKKALKTQHGYKLNPLYLVGRVPAHTHHTRMRLGLSALRKDLYDYKIVPDNICQLCGLEPENLTHYILNCPSFHSQRVRLLSDITEIVPYDTYCLFSENDIVNSLMVGIPELSFESNKNLFLSFQKFIQSTKRF